MTWLAPILAMVAGWLFVPDVASLERLEPEHRVRSRKVPHTVKLVGLCLVLGGAGLVWFPAAIAACAAMVGLTAASMVRDWTTRKRARARTAQTQRVAEAMESWMALGNLPEAAITRASEQCPLVEPVARAISMGGDPWDQLEIQSRLPGAGGLGRLGRSWRASHSSGASMAEVLSLMSDQIDEDADHASVVAGELAGPRASGKVMAVLPVVGIMIAWSLGSDPVSFFAGTFGRPCLMIGVGLACVGMVWSDILARQPDPFAAPDRGRRHEQIDDLASHDSQRSHGGGGGR